MGGGTPQEEAERARLGALWDATPVGAAQAGWVASGIWTPERAAREREAFIQTRLRYGPASGAAGVDGPARRQADQPTGRTTPVAPDNRFPRQSRDPRPEPAWPPVSMPRSALTRLEKLRALAANPGTPEEGAAAQAAVDRHLGRYGR